jgi:hypothetical protein
MFFLGFAASPAATVTISTPPYEKAALTSVDQRPVNRPVLPVPTYSFIAPSFQYLARVSYNFFGQLDSGGCIPEPTAIMIWRTTKHDDQAKQQQS